MKPILALALLLAICTFSFGQKLKADKVTVSFKSFEKQEVEFFGKTQEIYFGIINVKSKDSQKGDYRVYFPKMDGQFSHLTIRNMEDKILDPRLYYDKENNSFKTFIGTDKESNDKILSNKTTEEIMLSGVLIWLKIEK
jgi:hypothetical protein